MTNQSNHLTKPSTYDRLMNPLLKTFREIEESGSSMEINNKEVDLEGVLENVTVQFHDPEKVKKFI